MEDIIDSHSGSLNPVTIVTDSGDTITGHIEKRHAGYCVLLTESTRIVVAVAKIESLSTEEVPE
jgi:hypothetical protein